MSTATPVALTVPEVMTALRISRSKVYDLIRSKKLGSFTEGRSRRIAADSLASYIRTKTEENTPDGEARPEFSAGTVTRRKDGRYQAAVYVMQPDGTRARKYVYGKTWEECDQKRQELVARDRQGIPTPTRSAKLSEWLPYWLEHFVTPQRKRTTVAKYETHIRLYLVPLLGTKGLETLSPRDVRTALAKVTKQSSAATAKETHKILRTALTAACRDELIGRNVAMLVTPPRVISRESTPWSLDHTLTFLAAARTDPLYAAFVLAIALGMRRGEIVGLRWSQVDLDNRVLVVREQIQRVGESCTRTARRTGSAVDPAAPNLRGGAAVAPDAAGRDPAGGGGEVGGDGLHLHDPDRADDRADQRLPLVPAGGGSG